MNPILELQDVRKHFHGPHGLVRAVDGISLTLTPGEFVSVQGPSGCGKSTLLLLAGGLLQPDNGTVRVAGKNPYELSSEERARFRAEHLGFVFQQFHLIPYLGVLENVLAPTLALPHADNRQRAEQLIAHFGMTHRLHHVPSALSTGERQRTALARALLNQPRLLLADEPTGNLDGENGSLVLRYLKEFATNGGAVLLVTHDPLATQFATRALRLQNGQLT